MAQKKAIPEKRLSQVVIPTQKKNSYGWLWWLLPGALIGTGVYLTFFRKPVPIENEEQHNGQTVTTTPGVSSQTGAPTTQTSTVFPLKNGDYNSTLVQKLQQAINTVLKSRYGFMSRLTGIALLNDDGDFGNLTEAALKAVTGLTYIDEGTYREFVANPYGWATNNYMRLHYDYPI